MSRQPPTHSSRRNALLAEVLATLDEHLDGVTSADEAADLLRAALQRHDRRSPCGQDVLS